MTQPKFSTVMDWSQRFSLSEEDVVFQHKAEARSPRVTIGLPTYRRGATIDRALSAIAKQTYRDFVVLVSDNAGRDEATLEAIQRAAPAMPEICLIAQHDNIGALANINKLLGLADTEYFMWLADDDEITETYLAELVLLLDSAPKSPSAMGRWKKMESLDDGDWAPQHRSDALGRFTRVFNYVAFGRDDTLFYGLHRTQVLRQGQFAGFAWPNQNMLTNWCYVFLFDLIWIGPIAYSGNATWISHNYTEKQYDRSNAVTLSDRAKTFVRRLNVFWLYCVKTARQNPLMLFATIPASIVGFAYDLASAVYRMAARFFKRGSAS